jgi:protein-S-isoprenylcysteine O-methyltransferase Ste14
MMIVSARMSKMLPPTFVLYCLLAMLLLHWAFPLASVASLILVIIGLGSMVLGIVIAIAAEGQFRRAGTNVNTFGQPTKLVTDGWFSFSRNPMYLSLALMLLGAWLTLGSVSPLVGILVFLLVTDRWYIAQEEKRLAATFGKEYESYRRHTRRWL